MIHSSFSSIPRIIVASCLPTLVSLPPAFVTPLTTLTSFLNLRYERPEGTSWETNKGSDKTRTTEETGGLQPFQPLVTSVPYRLPSYPHSILSTFGSETEGNTTGNIIIKTTYDISLDFQDSLLPLGFLSLSRVRSSSLTLRSFHSPRRGPASPDGTGWEEKGRDEGTEEE